MTTPHDTTLTTFVIPEVKVEVPLQLALPADTTDTMRRIAEEYEKLGLADKAKIVKKATKSHEANKAWASTKTEGSEVSSSARWIQLAPEYKMLNAQNQAIWKKYLALAHDFEVPGQWDDSSSGLKLWDHACIVPLQPFSDHDYNLNTPCYSKKGEGCGLMRLRGNHGNNLTGACGPDAFEAGKLRLATYHEIIAFFTAIR